MQASGSGRRAAGAVALGAAGLMLVGLSALLDWTQLAATAGLTEKVASYGQQLLAVSGLVLLLAAALVALHIRRSRLLPADVLCDSRRAPYVLAAAIVLYIVIFGSFTFQRHAHFNSGTFDLGVQDQVVWNTARGNWYASSVEVDNYLGDHFKPLVVLFAPLYWVKPTPYWLLAFQTVVLALGAIPVYLLAKRHTGCASYGGLFGVLYLLYPTVGFINRFDFHWEATAIPILLAAIDAADDARYRWASLWLALALLSKEDIGLTVAAFGLWSAWRQNRTFGLAWFAAGLSFSLITMFAVIPAFRGGPSDTLGRYHWLGDTPMAMLRNAVVQPRLIASRLVSVDAVRLVVSLTAPLVFLPFFSAITAVALPALAYNLLSDVMAQRVAYYHYMVPIVPFVFAGAIYAFGRVLAWARRHDAPWATWSLCAGMLLFTLWHGALVHNPLADDASVSPAWQRFPNEETLREALAQVPADAGVLTTNAYGAHLAHRNNLEILFDPMDLSALDGADAVLFNLLDYRSDRPWTCADYASALEEAARLGFGVQLAEDSVIVLQRNGGDPSELQALARSICE